jgi:hypothetical protein
VAQGAGAHFTGRERLTGGTLGAARIAQGDEQGEAVQPRPVQVAEGLSQ